MTYRQRSSAYIIIISRKFFFLLSPPPIPLATFGRSADSGFGVEVQKTLVISRVRANCVSMRLASGNQIKPDKSAVIVEKICVEKIPRRFSLSLPLFFPPLFFDKRNREGITITRRVILEEIYEMIRAHSRPTRAKSVHAGACLRLRGSL